MALVDVFARDTVANGTMYPAGAKVPGEVYEPRQLRLRRENGTVVSVDDTDREYPEPREPEARAEVPVASSAAIEQAENAVEDLRARLAAASAELEGLQSRTARARIAIESGQPAPDPAEPRYEDPSPLDAEPEDPPTAEREGPHVASGVGTRAGTEPAMDAGGLGQVGAVPPRNENAPAPLPEHLR